MSENKDIKTALPKLRFPEFVNDQEWTSLRISDIASFLKGKGISKSDIVNDGATPCVRYGELYTCYNETIDQVYSHTNVDIDSLVFSKKNDVIIPSSGETAIDIATASCVLKDGIALGGDLNIIRSDENGVFLSYYLNNAKKKEISQMAQGIVVVHLYLEQLKTLGIHIPLINEQTKIAECLSSLDDAISGVSDKIEALKEYKKGLMQQLFPAEGKTTPAFRFPEFKSNKPWDMDSQFSKYIKLYRGSSPRPIKQYLTNDDDGINWIKIGDTKNAINYTIDCVEEKITPTGSLKSRYVKIGELILANSMSFGKTYQLNVEGCIYDGWFVLREYEGFFDKQFLLQLLNSDYMQSQYKRLSAGGIVQNISSDIVYQTIVPHTSKEEQIKIAECLSSTDNLITAECDKLFQLKEHKKGLMQQLFPNPNE